MMVVKDVSALFDIHRDKGAAFFSLNITARVRGAEADFFPPHRELKFKFIDLSRPFGPINISPDFFANIVAFSKQQTWRVQINTL